MTLSFLQLDNYEVLDREQMKRIAGGDATDGCNEVPDTSNDECYHKQVNGIYLGANASANCFAACSKDNCCKTCNCD